MENGAFAHKEQMQFNLSFKYFENIMENKAFALKEQMLHFPCFQIHDI